MDDTPLEENIKVSRKLYVAPTLTDIEFTPDTRGKATNFSEVGYAGTTS